MELFVGFWVCACVWLAWRATSDRARYTWLGVAAAPVACWLGYLLLDRAVDRQRRDEAVESNRPIVQPCERLDIRRRWLESDVIRGRGFSAAGDCDEILVTQSVNCEISRNTDILYLSEAAQRGFVRWSCRDPRGMHDYPLH